MPYMTSFTVAIPQPFRAAFDEALLSLPAPHLRALSLRESSWRYSIFTQQLPDPLFSGNTPMLRDVSLFDFVLPADPLLAFSRVCTLRILCDDRRPPMDIARHFPALTALHAELSPCIGEPPSVDWVKQTFAHLSLDELTIDCTLPVRFMDVIEHVLNVRDIRVVRLQGRSVTWNDSLFGAPRGPLSARLCAAERGVQITVRPEHRNWTRIFVLQLFDEGLTRCPSVRDALTYVRLEAGLIIAFFKAVFEIPALRELRIDVGLPEGGARRASLFSWFGNAEPQCGPRDPSYVVPCPRLDALTLFALDIPVEIDSLEAAHLGCALGQAVRAKEARARLVLVGASFSNGFEHAAIEHAYSSVQLRPFSGRDSVEDRQCPMWHL